MTDRRGRPLWWDRAMPRSELLVVGLGAAGLAACIEARRRGASVVGVDASRVGAGASSRNGGFLLAGGAPFHHRGGDRDLYATTVEEIATLVRDLPGCVRPVGSERRWCDETEHEDCAAHAAALAADGFRAELRDNHLLLPDDAAFDPLARVLAWAAMARAAGAALIEHVPLSRRLDTAAAPRVLVCIDGGVEELLPALADHVRTARLQMLATERAPEVRFPRPVYSRWGYDYWQQLPDGRVLLGGCRDRHLEHEFSWEAEPTTGVQDDLDTLLRDRLHVRAAVTHRWAGLSAYPTTGSTPIVGRVDDRVFVATGYAGTGNVIGPLAARALVAHALDGEPIPTWLGRPPSAALS